MTNTNVSRTYVGNANNPGVNFPDSPANDYVAISHIHPNIGSGTLSVFSANDLAFAAKMMELGHAVDDLTLYLSTDKGTQYALTISDKQKFIDLFYSQIYVNTKEVPPSTTLPGSNMIKHINAKKTYKNLFNKYFDSATGSIKETDTQNENVLSEFLKFMEEADAGVKLFDASPINPGDPPFKDFREIELLNGQPSRKNPC